MEVERQPALSSVVEETPPPATERIPELQVSDTPEPSKGGDDGSKRANDMFADLMQEVDTFRETEDLRDVFETHFSLGIAYREMGLMDEAIKEFQEALRTISSCGQPREMIQCCGMLSTCSLEKGMAKSAIHWCETGLGVPEISPHEALALRYDMGVAFSISGEAVRALECFDYIYSTDPGYRDIAQKIDELRGGPGRHVP
jgi:tetratricopeptide (TPR) repeat protein